ncbi:hypothetical protein XBO1_2570038 [Xenorhabdus bovienii str. oregonense]|uniref:Uncharacterized protein n=1 Tax=Xenorhabdus bovienii str. oregonense TaxID=1398202 RepID=A0A077PC42_XENBV|nr:hypothetical protein XBO1_2570038 [Xenorhabdus bovienii str. oregonense]
MKKLTALIGSGLTHSKSSLIFLGIGGVMVDISYRDSLKLSNHHIQALKN